MTQKQHCSQSAVIDPCLRCPDHKNALSLKVLRDQRTWFSWRAGPRSPSVRTCLSSSVMWQVESSIQAMLARQQHLQAQRERLSRTVTVNARAPKADWQGSFAWDQEVEHLLHESFGLQEFRFVFFPKHAHVHVTWPSVPFSCIVDIRFCLCQYS